MLVDIVLVDGTQNDQEIKLQDLIVQVHLEKGIADELLEAVPDLATAMIAVEEIQVCFVRDFSGVAVYQIIFSVTISGNFP